MDNYYIYILFFELNDRYYISQTNNLENRLLRHNNGSVKSTKSYKPWVIVWSNQVDSRAKSLAIESKIKSWKSKKQLRKLIANQIDTSNW